VRKVLERLQDIPTDIEPVFVTAEELAPTTKPQPAPKVGAKKHGIH
jgi:hypothetical protein